MALTHARLTELLHYDPATGIFTWRVSRGGVARAGSEAGWINSGGYVEIKIDDRSYKAHRLAWFYMNAAMPALEVDHENRKRDDNVWTNLREATDEQNRRNSGIPRNNTSGVIGVTWHKPSKKWCAQIGVGKTQVRKTINLGYFADIEAAAAARRSAEIQYFGGA
jgi:hypothetical protein